MKSSNIWALGALAALAALVYVDWVQSRNNSYAHQLIYLRLNKLEAAVRPVGP